MVTARYTMCTALTVMISDLVVNQKVLRLFIARYIGNTRPSLRYLMREETERFGESF